MLDQKQLNEICDNGKMVYCFDIDDTICKMITLKKYKPIKYRINYINKRYDEGNYIYLMTSRDFDGTTELLKSFGLKYHEIIYGKPKAHIYVDDSAENAKRFFKLPYYFSLIYQKYGNSINKKVRGLK